MARPTLHLKLYGKKGYWEDPPPNYYICQENHGSA
jgi:hypothetical protein